MTVCIPALYLLAAMALRMDFKIFSANNKKRLAICRQLVYNNKAFYIAGWSSLVARRAHNPEVVGSNPAPATIEKPLNKAICAKLGGFLYALKQANNSTIIQLYFKTMLF